LADSELANWYFQWLTNFRIGELAYYLYINISEHWV